MGAKLDIVTPLESRSEREARIAEAKASARILASHAPDRALELARDAAKLLDQAADLLYQADIHSPICRTREAAIKLRSARTAVDSAILEYNRSCSRERLGNE